MKNVKNKYVDISHICIFLFNKEKQMIVENQYLEDIKKIWKENNSGYISEESNNTLLKNNKILKIVYLEENVPARIYCRISRK